MAAGFSVKDALNKNSKAGIDESPRARFRTKDISIFKMYRNDMNFYSVEQIEELAGDILMYGLKQNLELVYAPCDKGEYRIVAGERRWEALKYLVSKGYKEFELATSKLTTPQDNDEEQVEIIIANAYRTKTTSDMIEEETRLKASLERMKAAGKKIKGYDLQSGRLREVISSMLHMSKTKVAQIEAVNNNLIPEWKEELKGERLTFSAAYELSGMTEDEQREALGKFTETGELTHKDVKDMKAERAAGQQVSESDTEAEIGMNPPEVRAGDDYETPHPEGITSICYSCTEYETCNVKTGTCTSCDQYKKLLKQINDKKNEVKSLVNDGKLDKAKAAKEELKELQNRFDLLYDLDEDEQENIEDKVSSGTVKQVGGATKPDKKNIVKSFVNIVKIKLRYVYDMFVARFTWLARVISFEAFSMMVDEALERMKKMLESNKAMQTLVSGEAGETVEKDM